MFNRHLRVTFTCFYILCLFPFLDPDWVNNLESDKLDDTEIEALSIDDSHTDQGR